MTINVSETIHVSDITPPIISLNTALNFTASSSAKVSMGNVFNYSNAVTVAGWFKLNSTTNFGNSPTILSKGGNTGYFLIIGSGNSVRFSFKVGGVEKSSGSTIGLILNKRYFICGSYDKDAGSNNARIYLYDDTLTLVSSSFSTQTGAIDIVGGAFEIAHDANRGYYVDIDADETQVYNRQLTPTEVNTCATLATTAGSNLQGYYKFDEGSGTTAIDSSGNGNTGTITNATYIPNVSASVKTVLVQDHMTYVKCSGTKFTLDGNEWILMGGSTYDISSNGVDSAKADSYIALATGINLNTIRIVNFFGGKSPGQWQQADYILDKCRQLGLHVILDLSDYCSYTGNLTGQSCPLPINRSNWYDFVDWLFARQNTINGRFYKDDDTIAVISIVGEVGANPPNDGTVLHDFYSDVSARIKAAGAQQIVHAGGQIPEIILSTTYTTDFNAQQDMLSISTIDCVSTHPYYTQADMARLFPLLNDYSKKMNKPWFIEEWGYNQTVSGQTDSVRASEMKYVYDIGKLYGSAGFSFWNLDGGVGGGFGINPGTPLTAAMVKSYADQFSQKTIGADPSSGGWVVGMKIT